MINTNVDLFSTYFLNINGTERDQTDQVQILRMDSKDFPCSSKRNLLCPADDFLSQPEMGENQEKITIGKKSGYRYMYFFKLQNLMC